MALVSVYDLDGIEHKRETVDARELVAIGWTTEPKESAPADVVEQPAKRGRKPAAEIVEAN